MGSPRNPTGTLFNSIQHNLYIVKYRKREGRVPIRVPAFLRFVEMILAAAILKIVVGSERSGIGCSGRLMRGLRLVVGQLELVLVSTSNQID
jgi:hypothetical protein